MAKMDETSPVERIAGREDSRLLLLCDHASNALPPEYGKLGLATAQFERHIAYDIGARAVTLGLASRLGGTAVLSEASSEGDGPLLEQVLGREPSPELAAEMAEECQQLLKRLGDPELAQVALWRMEGHSVEEIAAMLDLAPGTSKAQLFRARRLLREALGS